MTIVQQKQTGRRWGNRIEDVRGRAKIGSATIEYEEFDHWDGPTEAGKEGQYIRATRIVAIGAMEWP